MVRKIRNSLLATIAFVVLVPQTNAGVIFGSDGNLGGGFRWDADSREINGQERSLDGGLRYSLQGGSLQAYRDSFQWDSIPTLDAFETAVQLAFGAWSSIDPISGLGTDLYFVDDSANTDVVATSGFGNGVNTLGAEIDLLAADAGTSGIRGEAWFGASGDSVTLTSGTTDYAAGAISGADVYMNNNQGAIYNLPIFRRLLTHELGHALGFGDVEDFFGNGFIDDNYDSNDPVATLNNSWAHLVNVYDPSASTGLTQYAAGTISNDANGLLANGVDILMESRGLGLGPTNPIENLIPLTADDYGTRQFLYPFIARPVVDATSPGSAFLILLGLVALLRKKPTNHNN